MSPRAVRRPVGHQLPPAHPEHAWATESSHPTSLGTVRYVRCPGCGRRRVDLQPATAIVPHRISREL